MRIARCSRMPHRVNDVFLCRSAIRNNEKGRREGGYNTPARRAAVTAAVRVVTSNFV